MQIAGFQMYNKWEEKIQLSDLYIRPELDEFTTFSFDQSEEMYIKQEASQKHKLVTHEHKRYFICLSYQWRRIFKQ